MERNIPRSFARIYSWSTFILYMYICIFVSNYADDTALYSKATSLTNLFLRKILRLCKKSLIIIIIRISPKMNLALKMAQSYFLQKSM